MTRFTPIVAGLLVLGVYPLSAEDISVEDVVKPDIRAIGQTQGAGVPNAIGAGVFVPLHATSDAVTYVDIEAKANLNDRLGDSSIINTDVAGTTLSTSTRLGYRWINDVSSWMVGVYAGYDTRELKSGPVDTNSAVFGPRTVDFQQVAIGAEAVSNQWSVHAYALMPTGKTEKQINSHYQAGALDRAGVDVGYQINEKTKATVGYYHQTGDLSGAVGSGATAGLSYDINQNLTAGIKVSYDNAFETRVMATINYAFGNLFKGDDEEKEATTNMVMNALTTPPEQRDVRIHDGLTLCARSMVMGATLQRHPTHQETHEVDVEHPKKEMWRSPRQSCDRENREFHRCEMECMSYGHEAAYCALVCERHLPGGRQPHEIPLEEICAVSPGQPACQPASNECIIHCQYRNGVKVCGCRY